MADSIMSPSPCKPVPQEFLTSDTLTHALYAEIKKHKASGDEDREYAARAVLACLRVGPIDQVADALVEHFVTLEDYDE